MTKILKIIISAIFALLLITGNSFADYLGTNITIYDGLGSGDGWYGEQEDNEVETNSQYSAIGNQSWDLEGFFLDGSTLYMVGGWDFVNGSDEYGIYSGDIFLDTNGDSSYDYVLDMEFNSLTYDVIELTDGSVLEDVTYFSEANPWRYSEGGNILEENVGMTYLTGLSDAAVGDLAGGSHNLVGVDLSFLGVGTEFTSHFTMQCGNDNLMGRGSTEPVPEPSTMLLLGSGLLGFAGLRRKVSKKKK